MPPLPSPLLLEGRRGSRTPDSVFDLSAWNDLAGAMTALSNLVEQSDSVTNEQRFYRVRVLP